MVDYRAIYALKAVVAATASVVLAWELLDRPFAGLRDARRIRGGLLGGLGILALACWWNLGLFHFSRYLHVHELFHYYLGSKYFRELGYTRLYACTVVADLESGFREEALGRRVRDLATNDLETGADAARDPTACTSRFTDDRWQEFVADAGWFRSHLTPQAWKVALVDHGYNGTPVWGMVGGPLASLSYATDRQLLALGLLDPLLLFVMWGFVLWAFGWRTACVGCLWWGTNYLAGYFWTGGAFLRADWLAAAVIGICLARRERFIGAGIALAYASLLRIFPALIVGGLILRVLMRSVRTRSLALMPAEKRFAAGAIGTVLVLVPLSGWVLGGGLQPGIDVWRGFIANSQKHLNTPLANNVGLKTAVSFDRGTRAAVFVDSKVDAPFEEWAAARRQAFLEREWLYWTFAVGFLVAIALAVDRQEPWVALVLGTLLIPVLADVTCYYYSIFLTLGLLWPRAGWTAVALTLTSLGSLLAAVVLNYSDDLNLVASVLVLCCAVFVLATFISERRRSALVVA